MTLAGAMADPNCNILQTFADTILETTQCDSAGLSLLAKDGGKQFYWPAISGLGNRPPGVARRVISALPEMCWIEIVRCYSGISSSVILTCFRSCQPLRSACWFRSTLVARR